MEILQRLVAAAVGEIFGGCVKGKEAKVARVNWAPLEHGECTAHPDILMPKEKTSGTILPGDTDNWLEIRRPWQTCC